ncbi:hypothetical protein [Paenibacillus xanthanilyticus]|uniref:Uncharacterized protein n=1 Tax=Paenibacillus xanthanilyticus TaxID=1783531 RepID=A0ABV8JXU1_9BACL
MAKMKPRWLATVAVCVLALVIVTTLLVREHDRSNQYERHLSTKLRNDQSALIAAIYALRDDVGTLLGSETPDADIKARLTDNIYAVVRIAQDMDGMAVDFDLVSRDRLANSTSSAAARAAVTLDRIDAEAIQARERDKLRVIKDMLTEWTGVIERVYPGYAPGDPERMAKALHDRIGDPAYFIRDEAWQELILGLEQASKAYHTRLP